jgi:hypothetical protein
MSVLFFSTATFCLIYFLAIKRRFDFFSLSFFGFLFYFIPFFAGFVPQWGDYLPDGDKVQQLTDEAYFVAGWIITLVTLTAAIFDRLRVDSPAIGPEPTAAPSLAWIYLTLAGCGLVITVAGAGNALFSLEKDVVLEHIGYGAVLFEISAALAFIDAFLYRRWFALAISLVFLVIDLSLGFRYMLILSGLAILTWVLGKNGRIRLLKLSPRYGTFAILAVIFFLSWGRLRRIIAGGIEQDLFSAYDPMYLWREFLSAEPFVLQSLLNAVTARDLTCDPWGTLRAALVFAPVEGIFGLTTFNSEVQPILFPQVRFGMVGSIWAEMVCRFGYTGLIVAGALFAIALALLQLAAERTRRSFQSAIMLMGVIFAFYINRNDLYYTLLLMRRVLMVYFMACGIHWVWSQAACLLSTRGKSLPEPHVTR